MYIEYKKNDHRRKKKKKKKESRLLFMSRLRIIEITPINRRLI
jgi:hypothetical protein